MKKKNESKPPGNLPPSDLGYSLWALDFIDHRMLTLRVRNPKIKDKEMARHLGIGIDAVRKRRQRERFKKALWELTAPPESLLREAAPEAVSLLRSTVRRVTEPMNGTDGNPVEVSRDDRKLALDAAKALMGPVVGTKIKIEDETSFESVTDEELKNVAVVGRRMLRKKKSK